MADVETVAKRGAALTPAELRALEVMRTAESIDAAARELGLSPHTVNSQLRNARSKLGVGTTRQAIARAFG